MNERNGRLPSGWETEALETVCSRVSDGTHFTPKFVKDGIPFVTVRHIDKEGIDFESTDRITKETYEELRGSYQPRDGDVLFSKDGTVGKVHLVEQPPQYIVLSSLAILRPESEVLDSRFLSHVLSSPDVLGQAASRKSGTAIRRIILRNLRKVTIPIPPITEQRRIVAKIEALQERSRRAREALSEVGPLMEQFRQAVLAAAFRGDLTADWRAAHPDVEPTSELLHRIRAERRHRWEQAELAKYEAKGQKPPKNWKERYKEPEPVDDSGLPELPEGWCWTRLPELGYMNRGKSRHRPRNAPHLYGGPYPFVQTGDIAQSRGWIVSHKQTYSEAGLAQSQLWPEGTVCITIAANIASSAVLNYPACFPDSVVGLIPDESLCSPEFVEFFIRTVKDELERFAPSTAQKNINLETLTEVAVPLPPLEESKEITRLLTELIDGGFQVDEAVASLIDQIDQLDQSILAKAFRGELIPQDPGDEPASVLLERIRAQREQQTEVTKKTSKIQWRNKMGKKSLALASQRRPLAEVLAAKGQPVPPEQLLTEAGYDDDSIEDFYVELREEVKKGRIREGRPSEGNVVLEAAKQ